MLRNATAIGLALFCAQGIAAPPAEIVRCAAIADGAARLVCFDAYAKQIGATATLRPVDSKGKWKVSEKVSQLDDSRVVTMVLPAEAPVAAGYKRSTPNLILRCESNKTEAYIDWGMFITTNDVPLTLRFGTAAASTSAHQISTDYKAVFIRSPLSFVRQAMAVDTVLAQVTPHGESPVLATFDVRGLSASIAPLQSACGWR
jgi:type VI secretion system protein VasI